VNAVAVDVGAIQSVQPAVIRAVGDHQADQALNRSTIDAASARLG
jgi:hypothetical protein